MRDLSDVTYMRTLKKYQKQTSHQKNKTSGALPRFLFSARPIEIGTYGISMFYQNIYVRISQ